MTITEEIQKELEANRESLEKNKEYVRLRDFYDEMEKLGVAKKSEYDLPPLDTIGKRLYDVKHSVYKKRMF